MVFRMKTIKIKTQFDIPSNYTGVAEWFDGIKEWYLDEYQIFDTLDENRLNFRNKIILSKKQHLEYSEIQVWKYIDGNGIQEQIVIPGMEEFIKEWK